jgi:hypothetical protein
MSHYPEEYEKDLLNYRTQQGLYDMKEAMESWTKWGITASDVQARQWEKSAIQQMELEKMMQTGTKCDRNKPFLYDETQNIKNWHKPKESSNDPVSSPNKYSRVLRGGATLDVYDVLDAFKVDNPAVQHALKKMLCAGSRGHKAYMQDIQEAIDSLERAKSFAPIPF